MNNERICMGRSADASNWTTGLIKRCAGLIGGILLCASTHVTAQAQSLVPATSSGSDQWQCNDKWKSQYQISITPTSFRIPRLTSSTQDTVLQKQADGSYLHQDRPGSEAYKTIIRFQGAEKLNMAFTNLQGAVNLTYDCARATHIKPNRLYQ